MSTFVVEYDGTTGAVTQWRIEAADDYTAGDDEFVVDPGDVSTRDLFGMHVDDTTDPTALVMDADHIPREAVDRGEVSPATRTAFRDARSAGDTQTQLDVLFEILTGEPP